MRGGERGTQMRPCRPPGRIAANSRGVAQLFQREPVSSPRRHAKEKGCAVQSTSRDLASREIWERSLERSIRRRELLVSGRKQESRRRRASVAVSAAVAAAPFLPSLSASAAAPSKRGE